MSTDFNQTICGEQTSREIQEHVDNNFKVDIKETGCESVD